MGRRKNKKKGLIRMAALSLGLIVLAASEIPGLEEEERQSSCSSGGSDREMCLGFAAAG